MAALADLDDNLHPAKAAAVTGLRMLWNGVQGTMAAHAKGWYSTLALVGIMEPADLGSSLAAPPSREQPPYLLTSREGLPEAASSRPAVLGRHVADLHLVLEHVFLDNLQQHPPFLARFGPSLLLRTTPHFLLDLLLGVDQHLNVKRGGVMANPCVRFADPLAHGMLSDFSFKSSRYPGFFPVP